MIVKVQLRKVALRTGHVNWPTWQWLAGDPEAGWALVRIDSDDHPDGWHQHPDHVFGGEVPQDFELLRGHRSADTDAMSPDELAAHHEHEQQLRDELEELHGRALTATSPAALRELHEHVDERYQEHAGNFRLELYQEDTSK